MDNIKLQLIELADEKYREFNQKLCPDSKRKFLGIKTPVLRDFSKTLLKEYNKDNSLEKFLKTGILIPKNFLLESGQSF